MARLSLNFVLWTPDRPVVQNSTVRQAPSTFVSRLAFYLIFSSGAE